jgi:hypothetical protein
MVRRLACERDCRHNDLVDTRRRCERIEAGSQGRYPTEHASFGPAFGTALDMFKDELCLFRGDIIKHGQVELHGRAD